MWNKPYAGSGVVKALEAETKRLSWLECHHGSMGEGSFVSQSHHCQNQQFNMEE